MKMLLANIELDTSIQCRANIDTGLVDEYAERMTEGDVFPPVDLYGYPHTAWIADGWHRVLAAKKMGAVDIEANLHDGGRKDALKHALGANALHGQRRTNADKHRCVEIALKEFAGMSSRALAELCGVGDQLVRTIRPDDQVRESRTSPTVTGSDGKTYPAHRPTKTEPEPQEGKEEEERDNAETEEREPEAPRGPSTAMQHAAAAINALRKIRDNDPARLNAYRQVRKWVTDNE